MSFNCVTCSTEAAIQTAATRAWINLVKEQVPLGKLAKTPQGTFITSLEGLTDQEIAQLKICGKLDGDYVLDNGTTAGFTECLKAYDISLWWFPEPDAKYMVGMVNYEIKPFDPAWIPPDV